jgi:hypothetical protein
MSAGIKGNSGIVFTLAPYVAGVPGAAVDHSDDAKNVRITSEDKDDSDLTFAEAAGGDLKDFHIALTSIQSTDAASLWRVLWDNPGGTFDFVYGPHGNSVPTAAKPHFTGTVTATGKPEIGGEAAKNGNRFDFDYTFDVTGDVTLDDGA